MISLSVVIGTTVGAEALIPDPVVARKALGLQTLHYRFRRRFHREPEEELQKSLKFM